MTPFSLVNNAISYTPLSYFNVARTKIPYATETLEIVNDLIQKISTNPSKQEKTRHIIEALEKLLSQYDPSSKRTGGYIRAAFKEFLGMILPSQAALTSDKKEQLKKEFERRKEVVYKHIEGVKFQRSHT